MKYKIVVDSCCELPKQYKQDERFQIIPLGIEVGDYFILDDESFNQKEFWKRSRPVRSARNLPVLPRNGLWRLITVMRKRCMW